jgi:murein L,D-transpeptidase YafK
MVAGLSNLGKTADKRYLLEPSMRSLYFLTFLFCQNFACGEPSVELVRVLKSEHKLQLMAAGKIMHEFKVALGSNPKGHKQQEGDGKTPEGVYTLDYKKSDSAFHRAIHISYPNGADIASAKTRGVGPGGSVMIHGQKNGLSWLSFISQRFDWTNGCIALNNADMEVLWAEIREGTIIEIIP